MQTDKKGELVWFNCSVLSESTLEFYKKVFAWKFELLRPNVWIATINDNSMAGFGVVSKADFTPVTKALILYFSVDSIKKGIEDLKAAGGTIVGETTPVGIGHVQSFQDPDGNFFALWSANL